MQISAGDSSSKKPVQLVTGISRDVEHHDLPVTSVSAEAATLIRDNEHEIRDNEHEGGITKLSWSPRIRAQSQPRLKVFAIQTFRGTPMMGKYFASLFLLMGCFAILLISPSANASPGGLVATPTVAEQLLLTEANQDRAARHLPLLERDPRLSQAALSHARQMAQHGDISHGFPGEPDLSERGASAGVRFSLITENVAEAGESTVIHELWMHSEGHRANLLDPDVNIVGIAVVVDHDEVYAVEDFASTVQNLSLNEQEATVTNLLAGTGLSIVDSSSELLSNARQTCSMETGYSGRRQPWYIVRYTASRLDRLPPQLSNRLSSGNYREAVVAACTPPRSRTFSSYSIAVLLYP